MSRNKEWLLFIVVALLAGMSACTKVSYKPLDPNQSYKKTGTVRLFRNFPDVPYMQIGTLRAIGPDKDKLLASIVKRAKKIGAQGLVVKPVAERSNSYDSEFRKNDFTKVEYIMEAVALRFKP